MSMTVASGIFTAILGITTLSYTQNGFMAAGVGAGGAWVTSQCYKREQEQAERFFSAYPYGGPSASPAQTQQAQQVTASPTAEAHPTAFANASVGDTQITVQMEAPTYPYAQPPIVPPTAPTAAPKAATGVSRWDEPEAETLPVLDLSREIAREEAVFLVAKKNSGKTTTLYAAMRHRYEWQKGNCQWMIADPKGSPYMGLRETDSHLHLTRGSSNKFIRFLETAAAELDRRINLRASGISTQSEPLLTVVIDEWLTIRASLSAEDKTNRSNLEAQALGLMTYLVTAGREDRVNVWIVTHFAQCDGNGFNGGLRENFGLYALGRKPEGKAAALESIRGCISNRAILHDSNKRQQFLDLLDSHQAGEAPIIFTPLDGGVLAQLPDLSSFVDWQYPVPQAKAFDPFEVSLGELKGVLEQIQGCESKSAMQEVFGITKGGTPKWQELARWYDLVKAQGVDEAMTAIASSQDEADEDEAA